MINLDVKINPSFYKKTDRATIKQCEANVIKKTTLKAEEGCKKEAPYDTGALRRGHSSDISEEEGLVKNSMEYAVWVIHGTSKMEARNYPQQVVNDLASEKFMSSTFEKELKDKGVLE